MSMLVELLLDTIYSIINSDLVKSLFIELVFEIYLIDHRSN